MDYSFVKTREDRVDDIMVGYEYRTTDGAYKASVAIVDYIPSLPPDKQTLNKDFLSIGIEDMNRMELASFNVSYCSREDDFIIIPNPGFTGFLESGSEFFIKEVTNLMSAIKAFRRDVLDDILKMYN